MKYILQSYLYLITDLLLILIHDNYADKENEDPALVQCRPKEANRISQRSQYQVTESPNIIVTAATADTESPVKRTLTGSLRLLRKRYPSICPQLTQVQVERRSLR